MVQIGTVFAQAGWVPSLLLFLLCGLIGAFSSVFLQVHSTHH